MSLMASWAGLGLADVLRKPEDGVQRQKVVLVHSVANPRIEEG